MNGNVCNNFVIFFIHSFLIQEYKIIVPHCFYFNFPKIAVTILILIARRVYFAVFLKLNVNEINTIEMSQMIHIRFLYVFCIHWIKKTLNIFT